MSFQNGPFVQVACFCENVLHEADNVFSLVRIIDTLTHAAVGSPPPESMPPFTYPLQMVIMLKSGEAIGRHNVRIVPVLPSHETQEATNLTVHLEGDEKGYNLIAKIAIQFNLEGLHLFEVYFDEEKLTTIPLRVRYNRVYGQPTPIS